MSTQGYKFKICAMDDVFTANVKDTTVVNVIWQLYGNRSWQRHLSRKSEYNCSMSHYWN